MSHLSSAVELRVPPRAPVVLVIDDEMAARQAICATLEERGLDAVMTRGGRQALAALRSVEPDLVLTDIAPLEQEACEALRQIRRERPWIPIMAMSSSGTLDVAGLFSLARKLGVDAVIPKPFDEDRLLDAVLDILPRVVSRVPVAATQQAVSAS